MLAKEQMGIPRLRPIVWMFAGLVALGGLGGLGPGVGRADDGLIADGLFLTVPNPITSEGVNQLRNKVEAARTRPGHRLVHLVFDFNPDKIAAGTSQYGPCHDLADYILSLRDVITIAFVQSDVTRHTVLPVLACQDLVMAPQARLGDVLGVKDNPQEQPPPLKDDEELFYKRVTRNGALWAIVRKMLNRNLEIQEARSEKANSVWYVVKGEPLEKDIRIAQAEPVLRAGEVGLLAAPQARAFGLCKLFRDSRQKIKDAYGMPASSLRGDPLEGRTPIAYRVLVSGPVTKSLDESLQRRIRKAVGKGANQLFLEFRNCGGGDPIVARDLADFLRNLKDTTGQFAVQTIAYVPEKAPDTATFLALGCGEIVMGPLGELGDFQDFLFEMKDGQRVPVDVGQSGLQKALAGLAQEQGYSPLLAQGMLDRRLTILEVHSTPGNPPEKRLITQQEWDEDQKGGKPYWQNRQVRKSDGQFLLLNARLAKDLGVARHIADNIEKVYDLYGTKPDQVRQADPDWLDQIAAFLRQSWVAAGLVIVGIMFLILELKLPGVGLPGVISALCFVLFFWAHSQLSGQITMLAVLLFLLGLVLIGLEIFLLPGFGVAGVSGILLVLVSLGLVTLEKKPQTSQEWWSFANTLTTFGLCVMVAGIGAFVLGKYLHNIPYFNRLAPPSPAEDSVSAEAMALVNEYATLLGAIGEAATALRPAGMARFGDNYVDVVSDGTYIEAGARIQVIEIEGNRIVVKLV